MPKIGLSRVFVISLLVLAVPLSAHEPAARTSQSVALPATARKAAATVDAFHAALRRGDAQAALAFLADDGLIFESGGVERSKAEYAAHHLAADAEFARSVQSAVTRRTGDSIGAMAWIASEGETTGTFRGRAVSQATTETMVLRRMGQSWKIVHIHWSSATRK